MFLRKIMKITLLVSAISVFQYAIAAPVSIQEQILNDINSYRLNQGLSKLKMDSTISNVALNHSRAMADDKIAFGHDGFHERSHWFHAHFKNMCAVAENVAYTSKDARSVVQQWIHSAGHRKNIEGHYNLTGIGVAYDKDGIVYATQIFLNTDC